MCTNKRSGKGKSYVHQDVSVSKIPTLNAIVILVKNKTGEVEYQKIVANSDGTFERVKINELFGVKTSVLTEQFVKYLEDTDRIYDYYVTWKTT